MRDRIEVEFVEADVEMGFTLVDMAAAELGVGNRAAAAEILASAEAVFGDIEERLARLEGKARTAFEELVRELRRTIDRGKGAI
ncbi:MAG TPA: hypothetical protein VG456_15975 [Candidatus Sulfopaludibacter sp.]|nr:hypothetical protein [Candidatus Sulfopaludibacter sp.]